MKVVGEGGNLGLTQLGRIEFALNGGRVNTDAIDNSAGVDTSDHEVNIKILLNAVVANGDMTVKQRNTLLAEMTDEVGELVLRNNYAQNVALANSIEGAPVCSRPPALHAAAGQGGQARPGAGVPAPRQADPRAARGRTGPDPARVGRAARVHQDHGDGRADRHAICRTTRTSSGWRTPTSRRRCASGSPRRSSAHALRREIVTTLLVNDTVNTGGSTFVHRMKEETGASTEEVVRAHTAARAIFQLGEIWDEVEALDNIVAADVLTSIRLQSRRLVERGTRWLLNNRPQPLLLADTIELFSDRVATVWDELPKLLKGDDRDVAPGHPRQAGRRRGPGRPGAACGRLLGRLLRAGRGGGRGPYGRASCWTSPRSTTTWPTGSASPSSRSASANCPGRTAGSPWRGRRSAKTCTRRTS